MAGIEVDRTHSEAAAAEAWEDRPTALEQLREFATAMEETMQQMVRRIAVLHQLPEPPAPEPSAKRRARVLIDTIVSTNDGSTFWGLEQTMPSSARHPEFPRAQDRVRRAASTTTFPPHPGCREVIPEIES